MIILTVLGTLAATAIATLFLISIPYGMLRAAQQPRE